MHIPIYQVDAFTRDRFAGNPAAVMPLTEFLPDALLQQIAEENNLAETAYFVGADGRYHLRWFTPTVEVPLCGHATLASAAVILERIEPARQSVTFDTASGPLTVRRTAAGFSMDFPAHVLARSDVPQRLVDALGADVEEVVAYAGNYIALLSSADIVRTLTPDLAAILALDCVGVAVTAPGDGRYDFVSRYFAPAKGIPEDPVTGGAHCALVPYWASRLGKLDLLAFQASARGGEIKCALQADRVLMEGSVAFYMEGRVEI